MLVFITLFFLHIIFFKYIIDMYELD